MGVAGCVSAHHFCCQEMGLPWKERKLRLREAHSCISVTLGPAPAQASPGGVHEEQMPLETSGEGDPVFLGDGRPRR